MEQDTSTADGHAASGARASPPRMLLLLGLSVLLASAGWLGGLTVGLPPLSAAAWLALPVAVAAVAWGRQGALIGAAGGGLVLAGVPSGAGAGVAPHAGRLVGAALLVSLGLVVASVATLVRRADQAVLARMEDDRLRALEAVAERDALSSRLAHQAVHDALTGLPNRSRFLDRLQQVLTEARPGQAVGVLFVDLDDFKTVNDSLGHGVGDELLVGVARRLQNELRPGDLVARFGGDEFAALLLHDGPAEQVVGIGERLLGVLRPPFTLAAGTVNGRGSGGLVVETRDADRSVEQQRADLMRRADLAMYAAKAAGGGECVEFRAELQEAMAERLALQTEIERALEREDFTLAYQPVVDLTTRRVVVVEALLRWQHAERGEIPPSRFVPVAESCGAIVPLGLWVLEQACLDLQLWDDLCPGNELRISVNVSARQLREGSVGSQIARVLHRTRIDPRRLVLEVTESLLMDDADAAAVTLWQLRALGIRIAVDDFGTGYSSLSRLVDLPLDDLKIDRTFVTELDRSDAGATIITAAIAMAHGLGLTVVAEGVESAAQLDFLTEAGCDHAQGYLLSPPVPSDAVVGLLRGGQRLPDVRPGLPSPRTEQQPGLRPVRPTPTIIPSLPRHR